MTVDANTPDQTRAPGLPADELIAPATAGEKQQSVASYLVRAKRRQRERFLQRASSHSLRNELARSAYLSGCILVDALILPEPALFLPVLIGWPVFVILLSVAVWLEYRFYRLHFALPDSRVKR